MKKTISSFLLFLGIAFTFCNCEYEDDLLGNWKQQAALNARGRGGSVCFTIDNKAYLVAGSGYYKNVEYYLDTWQYDPDTRSWTQFDTVPASKGRCNGVGFAVNGKGYFGTGYGKEGILYKDFFEFDPSKPEGSQWTQTDSLPGEPIYGALGFSLNGLGYVGTGLTKALGTSNIFYSYDPSKPAGSKWSKVPNINPAKRYFGSVFIIDNRAYIFGGVNNGNRVEDFERFDPEYEKGDFRWFKISQDLEYDYEETELYRQKATAFSSGGRGYICCGAAISGASRSDVWEYIPFIGREHRGVWTKRASFEGSSRYNAVSFEANGVGYIMCGQNGTGASNYYDDVWVFDPSEDYDRLPYK